MAHSFTRAANFRSAGKGCLVCISAGNALAGGDDVGRNSVVIRGKTASGTPETSHNLVGDEQHIPLAADLGDTLHVRRRRRGSTESRPADRLHDARGGRALRLRNGLFNLSRVFQTAVGTAVAAIKGASIAERDASLGKLAQHWKVNLPPCLVTTNDYRTECRAVIALAAAHDLIALLVSAFHLILPCELECGLD